MQICRKQLLLYTIENGQCIVRMVSAIYSATNKIVTLFACIIIIIIII